MHVTEGERAGWYIVSPRGRLDSATAQALLTILLAAVAGHPQIAVDCSAVDFISSAGLGALLDGVRAASGAQKEFRVCAPSVRVKNVFDTCGLNEVLNVQEMLPC